MQPKTIENICLYRITHIENIPHILQYGIVHRTSSNFNNRFISIGDKSLINFRDQKSVRVGSSSIILGNYIPFYFGVRMPMLYVIQLGGNFVDKARKAEDIVYIAVSLKHIVDNNQNFYFSDGHATDALTTFYDKSSIEQLPSIIDWEAVKCHIWSGDGVPTDIKRRKQAEFLVEGDLSPDAIVGFACYNDIAKAKLISYGVDESKIKVVPRAYY